MMNLISRHLRHCTLGGLFCLLVAAPVSAHKLWVLPSHTQLSNQKGDWVTFDVTASNDVFYPDKPMPLTALHIHGPDGATLKPENAQTGHRRSTFDLHVTQPGTYQVALYGGMVFASFQQQGQRHHARARSLAELQKRLPKDAENVSIARSNFRTESYVTLGAPSDDGRQLTGNGLELSGTHPNDLYADTPAQFTLTLNGKPAANVDVEIIKNGTRFRDGQQIEKITTNEQGQFTVNWSGPGRYLLETGTEVPVKDKVIDKQFYRYMLTAEVF